MNLQFNSKLGSLSGMTEVDPNEAKTFKAMLGQTSHKDVESELGNSRLLLKSSQAS